jgi:hypothetical protein
MRRRIVEIRTCLLDRGFLKLASESITLTLEKPETRPAGDGAPVSNF